MKTTLEEVQAYIGRCTPAWAAAGIRVHDWAWIGSTYINGEGKDIDILVLCPDASLRRTDWASIGMSCAGSSHPPEDDDPWASVRDGAGSNVIFVTSKDYFDKWVAAARVCKYLQNWLDSTELTLSKGVRIRLHSIIMDGNSAVGYLPTAPCIIGGKQ